MTTSSTTSSSAINTPSLPQPLASARLAVLAAENEDERLARGAELLRCLVRLLGCVSVAAYRRVGAPDPGLNRTILTRLVHPGEWDWHRILGEILGRFRLWEEFSDFPVPGLPEWHADPGAVPPSGVLLFNLLDALRNRAEGRGRGGGFRHVPPSALLERLLPLAYPAVRQAIPRELNPEVNRLLMPFLDPFLDGIPGIADGAVRRYGPPSLFGEREVLLYTADGVLREPGGAGGLPRLQSRLHLEQEARAYYCAGTVPLLDLHPWIVGNEQGLLFWDGLDSPDRARLINPLGGGATGLESPAVAAALATVFGRLPRPAEVDRVRVRLVETRRRRSSREVVLARGGQAAPAESAASAVDSARLVAEADPDAPVAAETPEETPAPPMVEVGGMRLLAEIAHGKRGDVYRAVDPADGEEKAVLVLRAREENPAELVRTALDGLVGKLGTDWPKGLARVSGCGGHEGRPYLVLPQLAQSRPLRATLGEYDIEEAAALLTATCRTLAAVHKLGLSHGDLNPDTVWVTPDGEGLLMPAALTGLMGTRPPHDPDALAFRAPEGGDPTPAADVYGLGGLLYAAVTGGPPTARGRAGMAFAMDSGIQAAVPPPGAVAFLLALTAPTAADRPTDLDAVADDLELLAAGGPPTIGRPPVARRALGFAAAAAAVGLIAFAAVWAWPRLTGGPSPSPGPGPVEPPHPVALDAQTRLLLDEGGRLLAQGASCGPPERQRLLRSAVSRFDAALSRTPGLPEALSGRGQARFALDLRDAAVDDLDSALRADPGLTAPAFLLGVTALSRVEAGGAARARSYLEQAVQAGDYSETHSGRLDPWSHMAAARLALLDHDPAAAMEAVSPILAGADTPGAAWRLAAEAERAVAETAARPENEQLHRQREYALLEQAMALEPESRELARWAADALFRLGRADELENFLGTWISRETASREPFRVRGELLLAMGRPQDAAADLEAAAQRGAGEPEVHLARGEAFRQMALAPAAREEAAVVLASEPGNPEALILAARAASMETGSPLAAEAAARLGQVRAVPADPVAYAAYGRLLVLAGRPEGSDAVLMAVDLAGRNDPLLGLALAELHAARREWPEAEQALRRHTAAQPSEWRAWHALGRTLHRLERPREALEAYTQAVGRAPLARRPRVDLLVLRLDPAAYVLPGFGQDPALADLEELSLLTPQETFSREWAHLEQGRLPPSIEIDSERTAAYAVDALRRLYQRLPDRLLADAIQARAGARVQRARTAYAHLLTLEPEEPAALEGMAWSYATEGDEELVLLYLERSTTLGLKDITNLLGSPPYRGLWQDPRYAAVVGRVSRRAGVGGAVARVSGADGKLQPGDVVLQWDGSTVPAGRGLEQLAKSLDQGREASLLVLRREALLEIRVAGGALVISTEGR